MKIKALARRISVAFSIALSVVLLLTLALFGRAAEASSSNPNINRGNLQAGGSAYINYNKVAKFHAYAHPHLEYFVADGFSVGGTILGDFDSADSRVAIGPKATYYYWSNEKWAANVSLAALLSRNNVAKKNDDGFSNYFDLQPSLGLLYFILPSAAIGPIVTANFPVNRWNNMGEYIISTNIAAEIEFYF